MNCFPCFQNKQESKSEEEKKNDLPIAQPKEIPPTTASPPPPPVNNNHGAEDPLDDARNAAESEDSTVRSFTFRELATATKNFRQETLLGEGGFGKVFKGTLPGSGKIVAVRQLDRNGTQGGKDFVFEVSNLSLLHHPNIVKMVGYCADGEQRLLVYEYLPSGSLDTHLFDLPAEKSPLDWTTRMKIALGIAEGMEYLHEKADPHIIYRDLKSSNVLLNESKSPKLADCGLANIIQSGQKMHVSVMAGYNGYCAPEYERNGDLTIKSDVYSFGVVLLELITGRRALDTSRPAEEQSLVSWAQPIFKDPSRFPDMADPLLRKGFAVTSLNQAVGVAAMCLQEEPSARPFISDISAALSFLAMAPPEAPIPDRLVPILSRAPTARQGENSNNNNNTNTNNNNSGDLKQQHDHEDDDEDDVTSVSDDEDDDQTRASDEDDDDGNSSSEYEYGDSSDGSDYEDMSRVESRKEPSPDPARCKSTKSKKLGSSSKRKSKKQSIKVPSRSRHSRKNSGSIAVIPPTKPGPVNTQKSRDGSDNSSSSDEERWNDSQDTRSYGINSRSESTKDDYGSYSSSSEEDN